MFGFVVKYLGFLKHVPGMALLFDSWLKVCTLLTNPALLDHMDEIESNVGKWEGVTISAHKYGGMQFNYNGHEIGHIHSNGLLDMLLSRKHKQTLTAEGRVVDHHLFKNTGWVSFYIKTDDDKMYALQLLKLGHQLHSQKYLLAPGRDHQTAWPAVVTVFT